MGLVLNNKKNSARLENLVASHLLKFVHYLYDAWGYKAELHFLRDREGREVDFLVSINKKPWLGIKVKSNKEKIDPSLRYFKAKLNIPFAYQVINKIGIYFWQNDIRLISVTKFLSGLI